MNKLITQLCLVSLVLSGCSGSPPVQFYTLEAIPSEKPAIQGYEKQQIIGVGPVSAPSLLENKKIVTRLPGNAVQISDFQQWASPLPDSFLAVLTQNLATLQPQHIFRTYPWSAHGTVDKQIIVDIIRFDATPGKSACLEANWTLKNEQSNAIITHGRSILAQPLTDSSYPGIVHALSQLLEQFSQELALHLIKANTL